MTPEQRNRLRLSVAILLVVMTAVTLLFRTRLAPMAEKLMSTQVDNQASDTINASIAAQIDSGEIDYNKIVTIETDTNGCVTAVRTNIAEVNRLKTSILTHVDSQLSKLSVEQLGVPIGSILLPELFSGRGPLVPVRVLAVRTSDAAFRHSFSDAGINQTLHRITIDIHICITILTWTGTKEIAVDSAVLAAETVIVGTVPTTYFGMEESK